MTKLFKSGKQLLTFVLAFAILAVSLFTGAVLKAEAATTVLYWDGKYTEPTDIDNDGVYDIDAASDLAYLAYKTKDNKYVTYGKTYKVIDGVKAIILQPESLSAIKDKTNVADVKSFFATNSASALTWSVIGYEGEYPFQGTLDGNGATIYGMYNDAANNANKNYVGLLGLIDQGAVIKNLGIQNSYITTGTGMMGLIAAATAQNGAKWNATANIGNGTVTIENCEIINNYTHCTDTSYYRNGITIGKFNDDLYAINNCIAYGNEATNASGKVGFVGCTYNNAANRMSNVICLGTTPYNLAGQGNASVPETFSNVYTDTIDPVPTPMTAWGYTWSQYSGHITEISAANATGDAAKTAMSALDWNTVWFASSGYPTLRVFHNISTNIYSDDAKSHYYKCTDADCDLTSEKQDHKYSKVGNDYICDDCTHKCMHDQEHGMTSYQSNGDCVTAAGTYTDCPCGYTEYFITGTEPVGHDLVHHAADCGDCQTNAKKEHWICDVCGKIFLTDNKFAPMSDAVSADDLILDLGAHKPGVDTDGKIVIYDNETGHWYICSVCDGRLDTESNVIPDESAEAHNYADGVCKECGYICQHDFEFTDKISVIGDCYTDELSEKVCTICKLKDTYVSREAGHTLVAVDQKDPTEKMEGTKAHYQCQTCQKIFTDSEGKTPAKSADLVIPKLVPENVDALMAQIQQNNVDAPNTSPSDGQSSTQSTTQSSSTTYYATNTPTVSDDGLITIARTTNVTLESEGKVFPDDAEVKVERINDVKSLEAIKNNVKSVAKKFAAYDITAQSSDASVDPTGSVIATFNIPSGYNTNRVAIYYLSEDGKCEKIASTVNKTGNTVEAELSRLGKYVIVETKGKTAAASSANGITINWTIVWIIVAAIAALAIAGGLVVLFVLLAKKKKV